MITSTTPIDKDLSPLASTPERDAQLDDGLDYFGAQGRQQALDEEMLVRIERQREQAFDVPGVITA